MFREQEIQCIKAEMADLGETIQSLRVQEQSSSALYLRPGLNRIDIDGY